MIRIFSFKMAIVMLFLASWSQGCGSKTSEEKANEAIQKSLEDTEKKQK